jgi:hypothetical protein
VALAVGECMVVSCDENNNAALYKGVACGAAPH